MNRLPPMSRRGFLRALGWTTTTVALGLPMPRLWTPDQTVQDVSIPLSIGWSRHIRKGEVVSMGAEAAQYDRIIVEGTLYLCPGAVVEQLDIYECGKVTFDPEFVTIVNPPGPHSFIELV